MKALPIFIEDSAMCRLMQAESPSSGRMYYDENRQYDASKTRRKDARVIREIRAMKRQLKNVQLALW
jgi:hypothetical protein